MPALIIGETQRKQIAELRAIASANPQDAMRALVTADKDIEAFRDMMATLSIELPVGYFVCYSHEMQPEAGLCHHMSISVDRPKKMPAPEAVEMILEEFGMRPLKESARIWVEDVNLVTKAVNIVQIITHPPAASE